MYAKASVSVPDKIQINKNKLNKHSRILDFQATTTRVSVIVFFRCVYKYDAHNLYRFDSINITVYVL
jgi:hypothetical protein